MDFNEKCKNARAFVVLLAALIALILNIKYNRMLIQSLLIVIAVIIIFYIICTIAIKIIDKVRKMEPKNKINVEDVPSDNNEENVEASQDNVSDE